MILMETVVDIENTIGYNETIDLQFINFIERMHWNGSKKESFNL